MYLRQIQCIFDRYMCICEHVWAVTKQPPDFLTFLSFIASKASPALLRDASKFKVARSKVDRRPAIHQDLEPGELSW